MTVLHSKHSKILTMLRGFAVVSMLGTGAFAQGQPQGRAEVQHSSLDAPEIQPGLAGAGLVLLLGGTLILVSRRRPART